jgi:hypothetical protein
MSGYITKTLGLIGQDLRLAYRNNLIQVSLALCVVLGLLVRFVIPAAPGELELVLHDATPAGSYAALIEATGQEPLADEAAWREATGDGTPGVLLGEEGYELALTGNEPAHAVEVMKTSAHAMWATAHPEIAGSGGARVTSLRPRSSPVPFNTGMIPMLLAMDVIILGFMFGSTMLLQKKMNGTIMALRASPVTPGQLLISTVAVNVLMAWIYGVGILIATGPERYPVFEMLTLVTVACAAFTLLGLFVATFFDDLSGMFMPLMGIGVVLSVPMGTYFSSSAPPIWVKVIPTYGAMKAFGEMFFPTGRAGELWAQVGIMTGLVVVFGAAAWWAADRRLFKEAV